MKHYKPLALLLGFLVACTSKITSISPTAAIQRPNPLATLATTLPPTTTGLFPATPTASILSETIRPPLPDVILNIASWGGAYPLFECREHARPGQILTARFPYATASLLVSDTQAGLYSPLWSPNGNWIAYVAVQNRTYQQVIQDGNELRNYPDSDSLWVTRPNGSEKHQVSPKFPRQEFITIHNSGPSCDVVDGITILDGWSSDSQWIAFLTGNGTLYAVRVSTGDTRKVQTDILAENWAPTHNYLALVVRHANTEPQIQISSMENAPAEAAIYTPPPEMAEYQVADIAWSKDESELFAFATNQKRVSEPMEIWRLNVALKTWAQIGLIAAEDTNFGDLQLLGLDKQQSKVVVCNQAFLGVQSISDGAIEREIQPSTHIDCSLVSKLDDAAGNELVSFTNPEDNGVWVSLPASAKAQQLISLTNLAISSDYRLSGVSWHP